MNAKHCKGAEKALKAILDKDNSKVRESSNIRRNVWSPEVDMRGKLHL